MTALFALFEVGRVAAGALTGVFSVANLARVLWVDLGPFEHLWSLAVEEHFYLLWPGLVALVLAVAGRRRFEILLTVAAAGMVDRLSSERPFRRPRQVTMDVETAVIVGPSQVLPARAAVPSAGG